MSEPESSSMQDQSLDESDVAMEEYAPYFPSRIVIKTAPQTSYPIPVVASCSSAVHFAKDYRKYSFPCQPSISTFTAGSSDSIDQLFRAKRRPDNSSANSSKRRFAFNGNSGNDWGTSPSLANARSSDSSLGCLILQRELPWISGRPYNGNLTTLIDRKFYTNITPNFTVLDVNHPQVFLRKFSPDGRHLVAFSADLRVLNIYQYQGAGVVGRFFTDSEAEPDSEEGIGLMQREIFKTLFDEKFRVRVVPSIQHPHLLCRDFSLYTSDSAHVIVATSGPSELADENGPEVVNSNESLPFFHRNPPEDYRFILCSLRTGAITDLMEFHVDKIQTTQNAGVYLYEKTLAILSTQHQRIHFYQVTQGKFLPTRIIGQYCFGEMGPGLAWWKDIYRDTTASKEEFMSTLKQKLFLELFLKAKTDSEKSKSYGPIMEFHRHHTFYNRLKIWKFQMLDEQKLLIKWAPEEVVIGRAQDPANYPQFFTFFDLRDCRFYGVYENREPMMLKILEKFRDDFRNPPAQHPHFQSDSYYSRPFYERLKRLTINSRNGGGIQEACSRLLSQLPIPCQSFTSSPYVDMSLFQYDTSLISNTERVKSKTDEPIKFYSRHSGLRKFTLHVTKNPGGRRTRRFVTHIFHPTEPFIITCEKPGVQTVDSDIHFHIRRPVG